MLMTIVVVRTLSIIIVSCSSHGNIHLLEDEIAAAIRSCSIANSSTRHRRSRNFEYNKHDEGLPRIDGDSKQEINQYSHERRNTNDTHNQIHILNATDYDYGRYGTGNGGERFINNVPRSAAGGSYNNTESRVNRTKRNQPLLNRPNNDQCLSQCVFAELQMVDSRGIPREAELWNKVHTVLTSQQSRTTLRDQIRACFHELQTEAEDNGCSYSNKLERCLMLHISDRKLDTV